MTSTEKNSAVNRLKVLCGIANKSIKRMILLANLWSMGGLCREQYSCSTSRLRPESVHCTSCTVLINLTHLRAGLVLITDVEEIRNAWTLFIQSYVGYAQ